MNDAVRLARVAVIVLLLCAAGARGDWPQYRADASRSGYTSENLPAGLALQWVRKVRGDQKPRPAWIGRSLARSRMKFDWSGGLVASGGICYLPSSANDKICALDAKTGKTLWSFFTGGPVRFGPAVWKNRLYVVSDDGYLYCLSARDGREIWKLRAGPSGELVIGNGRMVSRWVARGGPAVRDGVVYFAAGIWPIEGVYIYAVNAADGKVIWCNDSSGALEIDQPHMVCFSRGGVAAQGYLAITADHVLVPTGRSVPACFDRKTGRFVHFNLSRYGGKTPWGTGGGDVVATDEVFFNSGMAFDVLTGLRYHNVGKRNWWIPLKRDRRKLHGEFLVGDRQIITVTPAGFLRSEGKSLHAARLATRTYDARREAPTAMATPRLKKVGQADSKRHIERIDNAPVLRDKWSAALPAQGEAMIAAGKSIIVGMPGKIVIVDTATRKTSWSEKVDGVAGSLAVSGGRLLAGTDKGTVYCFGPEKDASPAVTIEPDPVAQVYPNDSVAAKAAAEILSRTKVTRGFCLDLQCGDGALAFELAKRTELSIVALAANAKEALEARRKLERAGVYGVRVAVIVAGVKDLPDYFANLIVSSGALTDQAAPPAGDIARIQRPYGGTVCIGRPGKMKTLVRGDLKGGGSWTHNLADAGNTMCSDDSIVAGPLGMLWYEDETQETIDRHGKNPAPLVYKGLLLREGIDSVTCRDAYNGQALWEVKLPGVLAAYREGTQIGAGQIGSTCCIADDIVYIRKDDVCIRLDVLTGRRLGEFKAPAPDGRKGRWGYLACRDGILYGGLMNEKYVIRANHGDGGPRMQKPMDDHLTETSLLFALDAKTGGLKWTFKPKHSIRNNAIAAGKGLLYAIDREPAEIDKLLRTVVTERIRGGRGVPAHPTGVLLAIQSDTGDVKWRDTKDVFGTTLAVSTEHDAVLMGYNRIGFARPSDGFKTMRAYRASDGKRLWQQGNSGQRPAIVGRTIYGFPLAWDLLTGRPKLQQTALPDRAKSQPWRIEGKGQGCGLVAGARNMLLLRSATLGYYDLTYDKGWLENYGGLRAGCFINAIPACGLILMPDDTRACRCSYQNQATIALKQHGFRPPDIEPAPGQKNFRYYPRSKEPLFTGKLDIVMNHQLKGVEIRYTLDGSQVAWDSPIYSGAITITKTTPVRAAAFLGGRKVAIRDVVLFGKVDTLQAPKSKGGKKR